MLYLLNSNGLRPKLLIISAVDEVDKKVPDSTPSFSNMVRNLTYIIHQKHTKTINSAYCECPDCKDWKSGKRTLI